MKEEKDNSQMGDADSPHTRSSPNSNSSSKSKSKSDSGKRSRSKSPEKDSEETSENGEIYHIAAFLFSSSVFQFITIFWVSSFNIVAYNFTGTPSGLIKAEDSSGRSFFLPFLSHLPSPSPIFYVMAFICLTRTTRRRGRKRDSEREGGPVAVPLIPRHQPQRRNDGTIYRRKAKRDHRSCGVLREGPNGVSRQRARYSPNNSGNSFLYIFLIFYFLSFSSSSSSSSSFPTSLFVSEPLSSMSSQFPTIFLFYLCITNLLCRRSVSSQFV